MKEDKEKKIERVVKKHTCEEFIEAEKRERIYHHWGVYYHRPHTVLRFCPFCGEKLMEETTWSKYRNPYLRKHESEG